MKAHRGRKMGSAKRAGAEDLLIKGPQKKQIGDNKRERAQMIY